MSVLMFAGIIAALLARSGRRADASALIARWTSGGGGGVSTCDDVEGGMGGMFAPLPSPEREISTVAFGSCMDQRVPHPHWDTLSAFAPDLTVLLGDNVYGSCGGDGKDNDGDDKGACEDLRGAYRKLSSKPSFIGARAALPMVAAMDDWDYGAGRSADRDKELHGGTGGYTDGNEVGTIGARFDHNPHKDEAKAAFLDFWGVPTEHERRRDGGGTYGSYEFGPMGRRAQLIILDTRYSREYDPDLEAAGNETERGRMLGEDQWSWLEGVLNRPADVRLVVSSVQVLSDGQYSFDCWNMSSHERDRLYGLLDPVSRARESSPPSLVLILSGNRLVGGFYERSGDGISKGRVIEVTSSSLTHSIPYGSLLPCTEYDAMEVDYDWESCDELDPRRVGGFVHENNFGLIELNWRDKEVRVSLRRAETYPAHVHGSKTRIRDELPAGDVLMEKTYKF